jgi:hypothetical protein
MKTLPKLIEELQAIDPDVPGNAAPFEALLAEVVALRTPESIGPQLGLFRDNAQHDELMFSIIHGLEIFDDETYVREVLRGAASLCHKSPRWASIIFMRMLNSEPTRLELVRQVRGAGPDVKAAIKLLMEKINARSVQFLPKTTAVLVAAS